MNSKSSKLRNSTNKNAQLDSINLKTLFPSLQIAKSKDIDVKILKQSHSKQYIDVTRLIETQMQNAIKLKKIYKNFLSTCCEKITAANINKHYSIIYDIPENVSYNRNYNSNDCVEYIKEKLTQINMEILILSPTSLFILWENIGKNK